jgi:hypothetical protein
MPTVHSLWTFTLNRKRPDQEGCGPDHQWKHMWFKMQIIYIFAIFAAILLSLSVLRIFCSICCPLDPSQINPLKYPDWHRFLTFLYLLWFVKCSVADPQHFADPCLWIVDPDPAIFARRQQKSNSRSATLVKRGIFLKFLIDFIPHCFICRPSDTSLSEDAGIEFSTVANFGTGSQTL